MARRIRINYFYGKAADQFTFYRIPKMLFMEDMFRRLSSDAKILYGLMLDRMQLSLQNEWIDSEKRVYIYFKVEEIMDMLGCGKNKALAAMTELDAATGVGLIERTRQGLGKPSRIYVKSFMIEEYEEEDEEGEMIESVPASEMEAEDETLQKFENQTCDEKEAALEVYNSNHQKFKNQTSRSLKSKLQEVYFSNPNKTDINNTDSSNIYSNLILSPNEQGESMPEGRRCDEMRWDEIGSVCPQTTDAMENVLACKELIMENISYDALKAEYPSDGELIDGIVDLMLEVMLSQKEYMRRK